MCSCPVCGPTLSGDEIYSGGTLLLEGMEDLLLVSFVSSLSLSLFLYLSLPLSPPPLQAFSLSFSPQHDRLMASFSQPPLLSSSPLSFSNRRGNIKFSSARYYQPPTRSLRGSKRGRGGLSSFRSTRRTAARPSRTKGVFECLLKGLT